MVRYVRGRAAGHERQDDLLAQAELRQQVEKRLQQARVRGLVHGRRDHEAACGGHALDCADDLRSIEARMQQIFGRQRAHVEERAVDVELRKPVTDQFGQCGGA